MSNIRNNTNSGPATAEVGERRLTARSVIASTLLGMETPALAGRILVSWAQLFGIADGTARVALSRMVAAGELVYDHGRYELAGRLRDKQAGQTWSRHARLGPWDRAWTTFVVDAGPRSAPDRSELRGAMRELRMGELRESVWMRPANLPRDAVSASAWTTASEQCLRIVGRPDTDPADLARRLFDIEGWQTDAEVHIERMASNVSELEAGDLDALAPSFETAVHAIAHIRRDPLLPPELLPDAWPGARLREHFEAYNAAFRALWRSWYREQLSAA